MSSGNTLLVECGGHFLHSILIMYYYLRTNIAIVFCQVVVFSITAVSPGHFMIICEISSVWKKAVCSKFIYWKVVARLSVRKERWEHKRDQFSEKKKKKHQPVPGLLLLLKVKIKSFFSKQANKNKTFRFSKHCHWLVWLTCSQAVESNLQLPAVSQTKVYTVCLLSI